MIKNRLKMEANVVLDTPIAEGDEDDEEASKGRQLAHKWGSISPRDRAVDQPLRLNGLCC